MTTRKSFGAALPSIIFFAAHGSFAQSPVVAPRFEVASLRPETDDDIEIQRQAARSGAGAQAGGLVVSGARFDYTGPTLKALIATAFRIAPRRIAGSDWMDKAYIIHAVMPEGATKEQIPEMLRALLEERFHLTAHRLATEQKGYALVAGKTGLKLNQPREIDRSVCTNWRNADSPGAQSCLDRTNGSDGIVTLSISTDSEWGPHSVRTTKSAAREEFFSATMPQLAQALSTHLSNRGPGPDIPVVDRTGISGERDIVLEMERSPDPEFAAEAYSAALEKIGLRMEKAMAPVEMLIIDHLDKLPAEN